MKSKINIILDILNEDDPILSSMYVELDGNGVDLANCLPSICGNIIADVLLGMHEHGVALPKPIAMIALGADIVNMAHEKIARRVADGYGINGVGDEV